MQKCRVTTPVRIRICIVSSLLTSAFCLLTSPLPAEEGSNPAPPRETRERLPNGLTVIVQPAPRTQSVVGVLGFPTAPPYDPPGRAGLTHVLAHALLRAPTDARPAGAAEQALLGYGPTHVAGLDCASEVLPGFLYLHAVVKPEGVKPLLKTFAEQTTGARFDDTVLDDARAGVLREIRPARPNPADLLYTTALATVFSRHPARFPAVGVPEGVQATTPEDLRGAWVRACRPERAVLVLYGKVDPASLVGEARAAFASARPPAAPPDAAVAPEPEQARARRVELSTAGGNAQLMMAWRSTSFADPAKAALLVLAAHLQQVLGQRLQQPGDAVFVGVRDDVFEAERGLFVIHTVAADPGRLDTIGRRIQDALAEVREQGLPEAALGPLRMHLAAAWRRAEPDLDQALRGVPDPVPALVNLALTRARLEFAVGDRRDAFVRVIESLKPEEARAAAQTLLAEERSTTVVMRMKEKEK